MTRILLLGGTGLLGQAIQQRAEQLGLVVEAPTRSELDVCDTARVERMIGRGFDAVINCVAYTAVDRAETERERAQELNAVVPSSLARAAGERDVALVHFSSDYVFSGGAEGAEYREEAATHPLNWYGATKLDGERAVLGWPRHLVVRTSWLFGEHRPCFPTTIARILQTQGRARVVADQWGRPTCADDLANDALHLLQQRRSGLVHVAGHPTASWFDVAEVVAFAVGMPGAVAPIPTAEFPQAAIRPRASVLSTQRAETWLGRPMSRWEPRLRALLEKGAKG